MIGPERPATGSERWIVFGLLLVVFGFFCLELLKGYRTVKLSVVFMVSFLAPLIALHEAGHALVSRALGWQVCRIVIGYGRVLLKLRWGGVPIEVRALPLGGHVVPAPKRLRAPRLENALIYAAGPGAELLVVGVLGATLGFDTLLTRTESIPILAAQSLALLVCIDLFMNLVPLPGDSTGKGGWTDGLGMVMSPFLPRWHFRRAMTTPWQLDAEQRDRAEDKIRVFEAGVEAQPDNPFMRLHLADALSSVKDVYGAREQRLSALSSPELPSGMRRELRQMLGLPATNEP
jgi:hypothetical protein